MEIHYTPLQHQTRIPRTPDHLEHIIDTVASKGMYAFWFNPRNGKWRVEDSELTAQKALIANIPSGPAAPIQAFDPPGNAELGNDWVLVLKAVK